MRYILSIAALTCAVSLVTTPAFCQTSASDATVYLVDTYDPERDAYADVESAVQLANEDGKHVLLIIGGDWCIDCLVLDRFLANNDTVWQMLLDDFLIVKVNYSRENENEDFLGEYPDLYWFPHIFVLDNYGKLLHSKDTRELTSGRSFSEEKMVEFLDKWAPFSGR